MEELREELRDLVKERTLCVEDRLLQITKVKDKYTSRLQEAAVEFAEESSTLPLTTSIDYLHECPLFPGVYLIYYNGETSLYGNGVNCFKGRPIYVGMSKGDISQRLERHHTKINRAEKLDLADIFVLFIIVNINHYAPSIEQTLLEFYDPLWNNGQVRFSFGNADGENNKWKKYHIDQDEDIIKDMMGRVRNYIISKDIPAPNLTTTPRNSP